MDVLKKILNKTIFGVSKKFYMKKFLIGICFSALIIGMVICGYTASDKVASFSKVVGLIITVSLSTVSYPYTAIITDPIIIFFCSKIFPHLKSICDDAVNASVASIGGRPTVGTNGSLGLIITKIVLYGFAWACSICIAPASLVYLYIKNRNN